MEGTVDVEDGKEVRPHHYIRSILPEGPIGLNGVLKSGDELLEVNNGHYIVKYLASAKSSSLFIEFEFHQVSNCRVRTSIKLECCFSILSYGSSITSFYIFFRA